MIRRMPEEKRENPFAVIIRNHRARVGRIYGKFMYRIAVIRKERLETIKQESGRADKDRLAELRRSIEDNL